MSAFRFIGRRLVDALPSEATEAPRASDAARHGKSAGRKRGAVTFDEAKFAVVTCSATLNLLGDEGTGPSS